MSIRRKNSCRAAALALSLCVACASVLSLSAGAMPVYAEELKTAEDQKSAEESKAADEQTPAEKTVIATAQETEKTETTVEDSMSSGEETSTEHVNHAILVHLAEGYSLGTSPKEDAEATQTMLYNTDQFDESQDGIELYSVPENSDKDYKTALWEKIDAIAETTAENSITVFFYSGHGGGKVDGTACLGLGGSNDISAEELREHLNRLSGRVLVILSCCHSAGMIMPASAMNEIGEESAEVGNEEYDPEKFLKEFQRVGESDLGAEDDDAGNTDVESGSAGTDGEGSSQTVKEPPQYYFIAAANRAETSIDAGKFGGEDNAVLGHALGYDRNNPKYHVYAADTTTLEGAESRAGYAGDGQITMHELADYYKKYIRISSSPVLYPAESDDVLFTYQEEKGTPAVFTCTIPKENVTVDAEGNIKVTATVTNLTDHRITLGAGVYDRDMQNHAVTTANRGIDIDGNELSKEDGYLDATGACNDGVPCVVEPNSTKPITYNLQWDEFLDGVSDAAKNPFCLKVWDSTADVEDSDVHGPIGSYCLLSFYTAAEDAEVDSIDASALSFKKPMQLKAEKAGDDYTVTKTSSRLPVEIVFDSEEQTKLTNAACTLSMYASDLGEELPDGIYVARQGDNEDEIGRLKDENGQVISSQAGDWTVVFENVQPDHEGKGNGNERGSTYTYVMDTSQLEKGHFYALQVVCHDKTTDRDASVFAIIQRTDAASADEYQISEFLLTEDYWNNFLSVNGIPVDARWDDFLQDQEYYSDRIGDQLRKTLQDTVEGEKYTYAVTNWKKLISADPETWNDMGTTERFEPDGTYRCDIEITVNKGCNAVFTEGTAFEITKHALDIDIQDNGKKAILTVTHYIPPQSSFDSMTVELHRAVKTESGWDIGKAVAEKDESLRSGDTVILVPGQNCKTCDWNGLTDTEKTLTWKDTVYKIYKVSDVKTGENSVDVGAVVWKEGEESCGCSSVLYSWTAYPKADDGDDSSSDTGKKDDSTGGTSGGSSLDGSSSDSGQTDSDSSGGSSSSSGQTAGGISGGSSGSSQSGSGSSDTDKKDDSSSGSTSGDSSSDGSSSSGGQTDSGSSSGGNSSGNSSAASGQSQSVWQAIPDSTASGAQSTQASAQAAGNPTAPVLTADIAEQQTVQTEDAAPAPVSSASGAGNSSAQAASAAKSTAKTAKTAVGEGTAQEQDPDGAAAEEVQDTDDAEEAITSEDTSGADAAAAKAAEAKKSEGNHAGEHAAVGSVIDTGLILWLLLILAIAVGASIFIILLYKRRRDD